MSNKPIIARDRRLRFAPGLQKEKGPTPSNRPIAINSFFQDAAAGWLCRYFFGRNSQPSATVWRAAKVAGVTALRWTGCSFNFFSWQNWGQGPGAKLIVYVLPIDWYLADLPMESLSVAEWRRLGGHHTPANFDRQSYKLLFTRALSYAPEARGRDIVKHSYGREALFLVRVNNGTQQVSALETPTPQVLWGNIPTPMF